MHNSIINATYNQLKILYIIEALSILNYLNIIEYETHLVRVYIKSEQTNPDILIALEISHPSIKYRAGIIKHQDLISVLVEEELKQSESFSEVMMKSNSNSELHRGSSLVSKNLPTIEQQILELYFLEKT